MQDDGAACGTVNRVVLTPRRWRQVLRRLVRLNRAGQNLNFRKATVAKRPDRRGEHEISRKTMRAGTSGDSGVLVVTRVRSTTTKCTRGPGARASGVPHALFWARDKRKPRAIARRGRERALESTSYVDGPYWQALFLTLRTIWSASVICPACWCGTMAAGPDEFRLPRSLSLRRARGS